MKGNLAILKIETDVPFALTIQPEVYPIDTLIQMHKDMCRRIFLVHTNKSAHQHRTSFKKLKCNQSKECRETIKMSEIVLKDLRQVT